MKTGLFFGTYNPIHIGHIAIAGYMAEFTDLDEVWLVVSPQNPLKLKSNLLADYHRYRMVEIGLETYERLKPSNVEFNLTKPSYTINTLVHLNEKHPNREFVLIMGSDNLATLHKWKNYERLLENHQIYVYPRPGVQETELFNHPSVKLTEAPRMDVSATFIRNGIRDKKVVDFLLPPGVYDYIREMHFYK